jgi:hypothetical protein
MSKEREREREITECKEVFRHGLSFHGRLG